MTRPCSTIQTPVLAALAAGLLCAAPARAQVTTGWTDLYDGPPSLMDSGEVVLVDREGNVIVAGTSTGQSGVALYTKDVYLRKFTSSGGLLWETRWDAGGLERPRDMVLDDAGNVYVGADQEYFGGAPDFLLMKYSSDGVLQWTHSYDTPVGGSDRLRAIAMDGEGFLYATGMTQDTAYHRATTIKLNPDGTLAWERHYGGPGAGSEEGTDIAVSARGEVYVSCISDGTTTNTDMVLLKYDGNGTLEWMDRYDKNGDYDFVWGVALDPQENVVYSGSAGYQGKITVRRLDPSGRLISHGSYAGGVDSAEWMYHMAIDRSGNAIIVGSEADPSYAESDVLVIKFNPAGKIQWLQEINGHGFDDDVGIAVTTDAMDDVYVSAWVSESPTSYSLDALVMKFGRDGMMHWSTTYVGTVDQSDVFRSIAVGATGEVYVTGYTSERATGLNMHTVQYLQGAWPSLAVTAVQRGQTATLTASNLQPSEYAWFLYSLSGTGLGACVPALGNLCLDLLSPINLMGSALATPAGEAIFSVPVPSGAPLAPIAFQAVVQRGAGGVDSLKTATVTRVIQP